MKYLLPLSALTLLLTSCTPGMSDASIHRRLIGVWSVDSKPGKTVEGKSDGTVVTRMNGVETARGKWMVQNGNIIAGPLEDWSQVNPSRIETNKVLSISGDNMVVLSIDGQTQLTYHKQ
jgi:hypothetical protein